MKATFKQSLEFCHPPVHSGHFCGMRVKLLPPVHHRFLLHLRHDTIAFLHQIVVEEVLLSILFPFQLQQTKMWKLFRHRSRREASCVEPYIHHYCQCSVTWSLMVLINCSWRLYKNLFGLLLKKIYSEIIDMQIHLSEQSLLHMVCHTRL